MVLVSRPSSPGGVQDAYEALEGVFSGGEFTEEEAMTALHQTLQIGKPEAQRLLHSLVDSGCASQG